MATAKEEVLIEVFDTHGTLISKPQVCIAGDVAIFHVSVKKRTIPGGTLYPHYVSVKLEIGHRFDNQFQPFVGAKIFPVQGAGGEHIASIPFENAGEYTIAFRLKDDPTVISEPVKVVCKTLYIARVQKGPKEAFGAGVVKDDLIVRVFNRAKRAPAEHLQIQGVHSEPAGISMVTNPPPPPTDETGTAAIQLQVDAPPKEAAQYKVWVKGVSLAMDEPVVFTAHPAEAIATLVATPAERQFFGKEQDGARAAEPKAKDRQRRYGTLWFAAGSVAVAALVIAVYALMMRAAEEDAPQDATQHSAREPEEEHLASTIIPYAIGANSVGEIEDREVLVEEVVSVAAGVAEDADAVEVAETSVASVQTDAQADDTVPAVARSAPPVEAPSTLGERVLNLEGDLHFFMRAWADEIRPALEDEHRAWAAKMQELWLLAEELEGERDRLLMLEAWLGERASELDVLYTARFAPSAPAPTPAAPQTPVATVSVRHTPADPFQVIEEEFKALTRAEQREARRIYAEFKR